mgnify:CR=1 FL=1
MGRRRTKQPQGRPAEAARAPAAGDKEAPTTTHEPTLVRSLTRELNLYRNPLRKLRCEIMATVVHDFPRLSDLHALICRELAEVALP